MHPARFVSYCFVYSGALLVAMHLLIFSPGAWLVTVGNATTGLIIVATGVYRIQSAGAKISRRSTVRSPTSLGRSHF